MVFSKLNRGAILLLCALPVLAQLPSITSPPGSSSGGGAAAALTTYSGTGLTITAGTYFLPIGGGAAANTTEASVSNGSPVQATVKNLYVQQSAAIGTGNTATYTLRKNGVDQSVTCTIADAATTCADNNNSFSILGGDIWDYELVTTGTIIVTPNIMVSVGLTSVVVPPSPSFTLVSSLAATSTTGNGFTTPSPIDTTGATLLAVVVMGSGSPFTVNVTDSMSNTYTALTPAWVGSGIGGQIFYCLNPVVGTGHTFNVVSGNLFPAIAVEAWNIAGTVSFSSQNGAVALSPGSISASGATLFIAGLTWNSFMGTATVNSGFTISSQAPATGTSGGAAIAHIISSATLNPLWAGPSDVAATMATFK